jgi:hypothetical protein
MISEICAIQIIRDSDKILERRFNKIFMFRIRFFLKDLFDFIIFDFHFTKIKL